MTSLATLHSGSVSFAELSTGYQQATRVAAIEAGKLIVATGNSLYRLEVNLATADSVLKRKNDSCFFTEPIVVGTKISRIEGFPGLRETKSVICEKGRISVIDDCGVVSVCHSYPELMSEGASTWHQFDIPKYFDPTWGTTAINTSSADGSLHTITSHSESKSLVVYDAEGKITFHRQTRQVPSAVTFASNSVSQFYAIEQNQVSVWDIRSLPHGSSGFIQQLQPSYGGSLNCILVRDSFVAVAGKGGTFYAYDSRKMNMAFHKSLPAKHDIIGLYSSVTCPDVIYALGSDNELITTTWNPKADGFGSKLHMNHDVNFRAASAWLGLAVCEQDGSDVVMGACASGHIYSFSHAEHLAPARKIKDAMTDDT